MTNVPLFKTIQTGSATGNPETTPIPDQCFEGVGAAASSGRGERRVYATEREITAVIPTSNATGNSTAFPETVTTQLEDGIPKYTLAWPWGELPNILLLSPIYDLVVIRVDAIALWWPKTDTLQILDYDTVYEDELVGADFSPNGRYLAAGTCHGFVIIWNVYATKLEEAARFRLTETSEDSALEYIAWSRDGQFLVAEFDKGARLKEVDVTERLTSISTAKQYKENLETLLQGNSFARTCLPTNAQETYSSVLQAQRRLSKLSCHTTLWPHNFPINFFGDLDIQKMGVSLDLKFLYSVDSSQPPRRGLSLTIPPRVLTLRLWDLKLGEPAATFTKTNVTDALFGPGFLCVAYTSGCVQIFGMDNSNPVKSTWNLGQAHALFPRGPGFLAMSMPGKEKRPTAYTWSGDLKDDLEELEEDKTFTGACLATFSGDGQSGAFASEKNISAINSRSGIRTMEYEYKSPDALVQSSLHGIVAAMVKSEITLWWPATGITATIQKETTGRKGNDFKAAEFSPDGRFLAVGCVSGYVTVWECHETSFQKVASFETSEVWLTCGGQNLIRELQCITWSADGRFLLVGFSKGARIFDLGPTLPGDIYGCFPGITEESWREDASRMKLVEIEQRG